MGIVHKLQHWWGGQGPRIQVRDFVPKDHYLRLWSDTFPWQEMVEAVEANLARRFPKETIQGRPGVSMRVLLALEVLKAELACSDEDLCRRLRTDFAVMYVCGIEQVQADSGKSHFVLPESLAQFRSRLDEAVMAELLQIQAAHAIDQGLVSPEHLAVDTFVSEQGSQRVTDATTLYKAKKKSFRSSKASPNASPKKP